MPRVRVSSKYQVVIPREVRERLKIHKGQEMFIMARNGMIEMLPDRDISEMEGIFPGLTSEGIREEEDRL